MGLPPKWLALAAFALGSLGRTAHAEGSAEPVRIEMRAALGCPDEPAFFAQVWHRTTHVRRAERGEEARRFVLAVRVEGDRFVGRLVVEDGARASRPREVSARSCDDVVTALAMVAALAIDPSASTSDPAASPGPIEGSPLPSSTPSPPSPPPSLVVAPASAPEPAPIATRSVAKTIAVAAAPSSPSPREGVARAVGPRRSQIGVVAEAPTLGPALAARFGAFARFRVGPGVLGAGLAYTQGYRASAQGGAQLRWVTATVEGCPFRWSIARFAALVPCVPIEAGAIVVDGDAVQGATTAVRPWLTAGAAARLEIALGDRSFLELRASAAAPILRDTFYFLPASDVYTPPALVASGGIGAGIAFP